MQRCEKRQERSHSSWFSLGERDFKMGAMSDEEVG
jgi:hypothetical protein